MPLMAINLMYVHPLAITPTWFGETATTAEPNKTVDKLSTTKVDSIFLGVGEAFSFGMTSKHKNGEHYGVTNVGSQVSGVKEK